MDFYVLNGRLVQAPGIPTPLPSVDFMRGVSVPLRLQFLGADEITPSRLASGAKIFVGLKASGGFESGWLASALDNPSAESAWARPGADDGYYTATLNTNTTQLNTAMLTPDSNTTNDVATYSAMLVVAWILPGSDVPDGTLYVPVTVYNFGYTGDEGVPVDADPSFSARLAAAEAAITSIGPVGFSSAVTGYTGGGSSNLDGIATTALSTGRLLQFVHASDGLRSYQLASGTDAESSPSIIRPDDFNSSTNAKVWKSVS